MSSKNKDGVFDSVFIALQWIGLYQVLQIFLVMACSLPVAFNVMSIVFIGYHVPSHCKEVNDTSVFKDYGLDVDISTVNITYGECGITISSNQSDFSEELSCIKGFEYFQPRDRSLNSDWDLVCGKESLSDLLQTLYTVGQGIGAVVFTRLADRKGRKVANCLAGLAFLIIGVAVAFIPSYIPLAVLKVIQGAAQMGVSLTGTTLVLEAVPSRYRALLGVVGTLVWALCIVIYTALAYFIRDLTWRQHQLIIGLTPIFYLAMPWLLDEGLRWLGAKGKIDQVERQLRKAARMNNKDEQEILALYREMSKNYEKSKQRYDDENKAPIEHIISEEKDPLLQMFKDKEIFFLTAVVWFMWLTDSLAYYGLSLTSTEFHSNKYIGFGLSAVMEVLSAPAFWLTVDRFGRKKTTFGYHILGGVSLILSVIFQTYKDTVPSFNAVVTTLTLIGKFAISTSFSILWVYTLELYPTTIRNFAFGLASVAGRIGGLFAPFSRTLHRHYPWAIGTIFGSFCIIVSILVRFLPETGGQELPQTITDMKKMLKVKTLQKGTKTQKTTKSKDDREYEFKPL